jgi:exportin-1
MAESSNDFERFKLILRDFLISIKEFSATDNADLYLADKEAENEAKQKEEKEAAMRVPGMLKPSQIDDDAEL